MQKLQALDALGQNRLMLPALIKGALSANDRIKVCLSVVQAAATHALEPQRPATDLGDEIERAGPSNAWLQDLIAVARRGDHEVLIPDAGRLAEHIAGDLAAMARPVLQEAPADDPIHERARHWLERLRALPADRLSDEQIESLVQGQRKGVDSVHLLVMDLHKRINKLAAQLAVETIDGASAWELQPRDRTRVAAFMRGLHRTAPLKFDHPGLDTAATRDGDRLLLQNDIGTNDAHILVIEVVANAIALTYSDLHPARLKFFRDLLVPFGAVWSSAESRVDASLNRGSAYTVAIARFAAADDAALDAALEGIASRLVFLIDWNRARKRLQLFVDRDDAVAVLAEAARLDIGHRAWLQAGGERLVFAAMQAAAEGAFRIGDRLDQVLGKADARTFLLAVLRQSCDALRRGQPAALVADEIRMLLARHVRQRTSELDLLAEHAAYCQALAQSIADGLAHDAQRSAADAGALAARAKSWERKADHLVMQARDKSERQPRWRPIARLIEQSDDVADALEEAAFLLDLIADDHAQGWNDDVRRVLARLAATVLDATRDQVRALAIARTLGTESEAVDNDDFLAATWRVLQAERRCDELLREARRVILGAVHEAASLMLANDLAVALERASDQLLGAAYGLRDLAFHRSGASS